MNQVNFHWSVIIEEDWVILDDGKSLEGDVALKCESRNFRTYFEKKARPSSITEEEASLLVTGRKLVGEGAKYEKNIRARENLMKKVVPAKWA